MEQRQAGMDATRAKIVSAACTVLESGDGFSIEAVARQAGVARLTVYDRFGTREGLVDAVFDDLAASGGLTDLPDAFNRADPLEGLERFIDIFCAFYATHRILLRRLAALSVLGRGTPPSRDRNARRLQGLEVLLGRVQAAGHPGAASESVLRATHALSSFAFVDELAGPDDPRHMGSHVNQLVREGIRLAGQG